MLDITWFKGDPHNLKFELEQLFPIGITTPSELYLFLDKYNIPKKSPVAHGIAIKQKVMVLTTESRRQASFLWRLTSLLYESRWGLAFTFSDNVLTERAFQQIQSDSYDWCHIKPRQGLEFCEGTLIDIMVNMADIGI